jgi:hypothetical protein
MDGKENVICRHNATLFSLQKRGNSVTRDTWMKQEYRAESSNVELVEAENRVMVTRVWERG